MKCHVWNALIELREILTENNRATNVTQKKSVEKVLILQYSYLLIEIPGRKKAASLMFAKKKKKTNLRPIHI